MSPNKARIRLRDYLLQQETYIHSLRQSIAKTNLQKKRAALGISAVVTQVDIDFYISTHYEKIEEQLAESISDLVLKAIPDSQIIFILKNIGVLAIFLLPPLYSLSAYVCALWALSPTEYFKIGTGIVGILLLFIILFASCYAFIRERFKTEPLAK